MQNTSERTPDDGELADEYTDATREYLRSIGKHALADRAGRAESGA